MITDEQAFWSAIAANPDDDLPLLTFADWLDEQGDPLAQTIRDAVAENRRPIAIPSGEVAWVTGKRLHYNSVGMDGRNWLPEIYYSVLQPHGRESNVTVEDVAVHYYPSVADAWRDLHAATEKLRNNMIDSKTGRSVFAGMTGSRWRDEAKRVIAVKLAKLHNQTYQAKAKALRDAYPFGARRGWPYKMWLQEQRRALGPKPGSVSVMALGSCGWCHGKGCVACAGKRFAESEEAS